MASQVLALFAVAAILLARAANAIQLRGLLPRETSKAEELEKTSGGVSPTPTSRPEWGAMELLRREDPLPPDNCGWFADYKSESLTCGQIGASCINIGSIRGCCNGPTLSCVSTFFSACIPSSRVPSGNACGSRTLCCSNSIYPECGGYVMSSSAAPSVSYTMLDCFEPGFGKTLAMQDYQPLVSANPPPNKSTKADSPTQSTFPAPPPTVTMVVPGTQVPPTGAIVGGVIGGLALIVLLVLGIFLLRRRKTSPPHEEQQAAAQPYQPTYKQSPCSPDGQLPSFSQPQQFNGPGMQGAVPPLYDPRYSAVGQEQASGGSPSPNPSTESPFANPALRFGLTHASQSQIAMAQPPEDGNLPSERPTSEVEAVHPFGTRDNRAELAAAWKRGDR